MASGIIFLENKGTFKLDLSANLAPVAYLGVANSAPTQVLI